MEDSPPSLFKQGPSALARLVIFVVLALGLLIADARFKALEKVRHVLGVGLYPLQRVALAPRDAIRDTQAMLVSSQTLRAKNAALQKRNLTLSLAAMQAAQLVAENRHLRDLLHLTQRPDIVSIPAEIQYDTRDPFSQKVVINRGKHAGVQVGALVIDESGVLGQVTRVYDWQSEVTLITDKDQAIPVQVVRTGLRSVAYGMPRGATLDLRFVPTSADIKNGDLLVTSGLDGMFPAGLPVARVTQVEHQPGNAFINVSCVPIAMVNGARQLLVLHYPPVKPYAPETASAVGAAVVSEVGVSASATVSAPVAVLTSAASATAAQILPTPISSP